MEWNSDYHRQSLKTVLKWEIQNLLQRLSDIGEDSIVLSVNISDGDVNELGSQKGQDFLSASDLGGLKAEFLSYCKDCEYTEIIPVNTAKRRLQQNSSKRKRKAPQHQLYDDTSSDGGALSGDTLPGHALSGFALSDSAPLENALSASIKQEAVDSDTRITAVNSLYKKERSRRKTTPKKAATHRNLDDLNDSVTKNQDCLPNQDILKMKIEPDIQTVGNSLWNNGSFHLNLENDQLYMKELNAEHDNQNEDIPYEAKEAFEPKLPKTQPKISIQDTEAALSNSKGKTLVSILKPNLKQTFKLLENSDSNSDANTFQAPIHPTNLKPKTKSKMKNTARKSVAVNSDIVSFHTAGNVEHLSVKEDISTDDLPVKLLASRTVIDSDGIMKIVTDDFDVSGNCSPKLELPPTVETSLSPYAIRPPGKGFKAPAVDEDPSETALLDTSKLGIGRYQCPVCFLTTRDRHDLKRHLRTHTKEKPFMCQICNKKFTRKWDLENHLHRHTDKDGYQLKDFKIKERHRGHSNMAMDETYSNLVHKLLQGIREGKTGMELLDANSGITVEGKTGVELLDANSGIKVEAKTGMELLDANSGITVEGKTGVELLDANSGIKVEAKTGMELLDANSGIKVEGKTVVELLDANSGSKIEDTCSIQQEYSNTPAVGANMNNGLDSTDNLLNDMGNVESGMNSDEMTDANFSSSLCITDVIGTSEVYMDVDTEGVKV